MIASAEAELGRRTAELLTRERLSETGIALITYSTPRRLAVHVAGVKTAQQDAEEQLSGPAWSIAFKNGTPTAAAEAFAKKAGVAVEALEKITTPKGEYVSARIHRPGRAAAEVLTELLPKEIAALYWAKNMYWRAGRPERFVRPVKWLLALLDGATVPFEFAGVRASNLSYGHRVLYGAAPIIITRPSTYLPSLEKACVMADVSARRYTIRKALDRATRTVAGLRWREDGPLVDSVTHLTEWPTAVLGSFEPEFLTLPEEVLVTVMRDHQKYFAVEDAVGRLAPHFLAVLNTAVDDQAIIRHGNERVLRARFNDARFFWNFDQKISLEDRFEMLKAVTFHKDLGSYHAKTERTSAIVNRLAQLVVARAAIVDEPSLTSAARLAKTDLTTELVKEFTELQGIVGGLYARAQGHSEAVAAAIYSQYQPSSASDPIPPTIEGQLLGLADRIGTIMDMFAIGFAPSGSKDPYALRRAGNAIVKILAEGVLPLTLADVTGTGDPAVSAFLAERVEFYLRDVRGAVFDVVKAVLAADADDVRDALARAEALSSVRASDDFNAIAAAFKRSKNILRQAAEKSLEPATSVDVALLTDAAEQSLYAAATALVPVVEAHRAARSYPSALAQIATLRPHVDLFFDRVMVMVDDPAVRGNRLALIAGVLAEFSKIADFSEMSVQDMSGRA